METTSTPPNRPNLAFVFPGQGSQFVGMGKSLVEVSPAARKVFEEADKTLGFSLSNLCFFGPEEELRDTVNAQPAILTTSIASLAAIREQLGPAAQQILPRFVAGHSQGVYSALVAAGVLEFSTAIQIVRERGRLMKESGDRTPGGMAAVIGLDAKLLEDLCRRVVGKGVVCAANFNTPTQTVISAARDHRAAGGLLVPNRPCRHYVALGNGHQGADLGCGLPAS